MSHLNEKFISYVLVLKDCMQIGLCITHFEELILTLLVILSWSAGLSTSQICLMEGVISYFHSTYYQTLRQVICSCFFLQALRMRVSLLKSVLFLFCLILLANETPASTTFTQTSPYHHTTIMFSPKFSQIGFLFHYAQQTC